MNKLLNTLYKLIDDVNKREHLTPDSQVMIPIPKIHVDNKREDVVEFIKTIGKLDKNGKVPVSVTIEPKRTTYKGNTYETIDFVFKFDTPMDMEQLAETIGVSDTTL